MSRYIRLLHPMGRRRKKGGKTAGLESLVLLGLRVPRTYVVSVRAHQRCGDARKRRRLLSALRHEVGLLDLPSESAVAVRSSASQEDGSHKSLAGQYKSHLHVRGVEQVLEAIQDVWELGGALRTERMEVLIQEMIEPVSSGASFSRNPLTGADEVIIEAVEGTSERLLQGRVTPKRWTIRKDKAKSDWDRLPTMIVQTIVDTTRYVAKELQYPADLEWAYDGENLWWLQVRPITSLRGLAVYSNAISREYLPGLVKPLVWSVNVPMINGAWVDLFERIVGPLSIDPLSLAKQFCYRAYFNMSGMGELFRRLGLEEDTLEQLLGIVAPDAKSAVGFRWKMIVHLPRVLRFAVWIMTFHSRVSSWVRRESAQLDKIEAELASISGLREALEWVDKMLPLMREAACHRILALLLHLGVGQLGRKALARQGMTDPSELEVSDPRLDELDVAQALRTLAQTFAELPEVERHNAESLALTMFLQRPETRVFSAEFFDFLARFGHLSESGNDFSAKPWNSNPSKVLSMVIASAAVEAPVHRDHGLRSHTRQANRWARRVTKRRVDRERIGSLFSRGFYLLHCWALRLGEMLEVEGNLEEAEDVFLLQKEELRDLAEGHLSKADAKTAVLMRKDEMAKAASISLPDQILGDQIPDDGQPSASEAEREGIAVSRGVREGRICVVRSLEDASRFRDGDILVVPFSDVAWAPLFARAGAIVAEAGGILSHSAIVARELGIPAIVSVPRACALPDGVHARVDGLKGRITLLDAS